jgi:outer membrane receptor for ferrienterochelin and colicins
VALGAAHVNYIQSIINTIADDDDPTAIRYANRAEPALTAGIEVELRHEFRRGVMFEVSYGYEHARYLQENAATARLINAPLHLGGARGVIPIVKDIVSLGARVTLEAPRRISITSDEVTGTAWVADITLSGSVKRFGLSYVLGIYNVTDARYAYPVTETYLSKTVPQNGRTLLADLTFTYP